MAGEGVVVDWCPWGSAPVPLAPSSARGREGLASRHVGGSRRRALSVCTHLPGVPVLYLEQSALHARGQSRDVDSLHSFIRSFIHSLKK